MRLAQRSRALRLVLLALAAYLWWRGEYNAAAVLLIGAFSVETGNRRPDPPAPML